MGSFFFIFLAFSFVCVYFGIKVILAPLSELGTVPASDFLEEITVIDVLFRILGKILRRSPLGRSCLLLGGEGAGNASHKASDWKWGDPASPMRKAWVSSNTHSEDGNPALTLTQRNVEEDGVPGIPFPAGGLCIFIWGPAQGRVRATD